VTTVRKGRRSVFRPNCRRLRQQAGQLSAGRSAFKSAAGGSQQPTACGLRPTEGQAVFSVARAKARSGADVDAEDGRGDGASRAAVSREPINAETNARRARGALSWLHFSLGCENPICSHLTDS
jgi:hypothetical protein